MNNTSQMTKATIVILDYKKAPRVVENVRSILAQKKNFEVKIVVVDNSNDVKNAELLQPLASEKNVELIINKGNLGYTKANNLGAKEAEGDYIFIVNPDIIWREEDTLQKMVDYLDANPEVGILGPAQKNDDGTRPLVVRAFPHLFLQIARRTWLRKLPLIKSWVAKDECQDLDPNKTQEVDWLQSSFFAVRKDLWQSLGGFNEDYFLFMADSEMCWRAWKNGKKVVYFAETTVYADGKRCSDGGLLDFFKSKTMQWHFKDSLKYSRNHFLESKPR